ncbi:MAG: PmoA family protein, partial [Bacteroidales bacterium]|nr:PmoA family protein [Bacteroidales bacterium]
MKARAQIISLVFFLSLTLSSLAQVQVARITIKDPGMAGAAIPVKLDLKPGTIAQNQAFILYEAGRFDAEKIPAQISFGTTDQLSWVYTSNGNPNSTRTFELVKDTVEAQCIAPLIGNTITQQNATLNATINDTTFVISKNGRALLQYRHVLLPPVAGESDKWARSGFIHPLYSPSGEVLTWVQPPDHLHHMGLWNPWTKVSWKGVHTDFWNLGQELGTVKFKNLIALESGAVFAEIRVVHDHVAFVDNDVADTLTGVQEYNGHGFHPAGKKSFIVMNEEWIIRVWNISNGYLLDFTSLITNVTDEPISLDAYRYGGGLGYRATKKWNNTNSKVLTSEGKTWE